MGRKAKDWKASCRLNGKRWRAEYQWRPGGTSDTHSFATEGEGLLWLAETEKALRLGSHIDPDMSQVTFGDYFEGVFWPAVTGKAEETAYGQLSMYRNHIQPYWGRVELRAISTPGIKVWRSALATAPKVSGKGTLSPSTQGRVYWVFHQAIATAVEDGYLVRSPAPRKSGLPQSQPTVPTFFSPDELKMVVDNSPDPDLMRVLGFGGLRQGEAFALRVNDLDFGRKTLRVDEKVRRSPGRGLVIEPVLKRSRSHRVVPMPTTVMEALYKRVVTREIKANGLLFTDQVGNLIDADNWRKRDYARSLKAAGLPYERPHVLRHSAASMWFRARLDMVTVARLLGDTVRVAEEIYVHLDHRNYSEVSNTMDAFLAAEAGQTGLRLVT